MSRQLNVLSAVQTRSGLLAVKDMWMDRIESNPWVDYNYAQSSLWEKDAIVFPIFALKYEWDGFGKSFLVNRALTVFAVFI